MRLARVQARLTAHITANRPRFIRQGCWALPHSGPSPSLWRRTDAPNPPGRFQDPREEHRKSQ